MENKLNKYLLIIMCGLAPYWFMNATIWIPWLYSRTLGLILMIVFVPVLWGGFAYLCLRSIDFAERAKAKWNISMIFLGESLLSDLFFFLVWRKLSVNELYHWTTFAAYFLVFIIPLIVGCLIRKTTRPLIMKTNRLLIFISLIVIVSFAATLYFVRFW